MYRGTTITICPICRHKAVRLGKALLCLRCWLVIWMMLALLVSCSAMPDISIDTITRTPDATRTLQAIEGTQDAQAARRLAEMQAQATLDAAEQWRATGTAQAMQIHAQATQAAIMATQAAASTATERAWLVQGWTATADVARSTQEAHYTQQAVAIHATQEAQAIAASATYTAQAVFRQATEYKAASIAQATVYAAQAVEADQAAERTKMTNSAIAWGQVLALPIAAAVLVLLIILAARYYAQYRIIRREANGAAPVIIQHGKVVAADNMIDPWLDVLKPLLLPVNIQARMAEYVQMVRLLQAAGGSPTQVARLLESSVRPEEQHSLAIPASAPWPAFQSWNGQNFLLGVGDQGKPVTFDPLRTPHLLVAGTSGAGKSMCILRPMAAAALSKGYQVIMVNGAGGDFAMLEHANLIDGGEGPQAAVDVLEALAADVDERSAILKQARVTTWNQLKSAERYPVMVIVDELVSLAWSAPGDLRSRIWKACIHITSKGRKMGLVFVGASTDPTARTLGREGLVVRDNCARVMLRVMDKYISTILVNQPGGESLPDDHFMARMAGQIHRGVAFHPSDDQIVGYVRGLAAPVLPAPEWMTRVPDESMEEKIRRLAEQGFSMRRIEQDVFEYTGGAAHEAVKRVVDAATGSATATTIE